MSTAADYLHAAVFGPRHRHYCGTCRHIKFCSDIYCEPGPKQCLVCYLMRERKIMTEAGHAENCDDWDCAPGCKANA